ncbi:Glyco_tranf_GTA_type domain containing protein [Oxalobacteraceae bacterium]
MKKLSLISHYYNSHDKAQHLIDHLAQAKPETLEHLELIIVDDCSNEERMLTAPNFSLKYLRIIDDIPWNQAGARNLGALTSEGRWQLFFDIDQRISHEGLDYVVEHCDGLSDNVMHYFLVNNFIDSNTNEQLLTHPNTFLVNSIKFRINGLYDEDFAGNYGYEDLYLPYLWERNGGVRAVLGNEFYFTDQHFKTTSLNRDLEPNKIISSHKLMNGLKRPKSLLRFEWKIQSMS